MLQRIRFLIGVLWAARRGSHRRAQSVREFCARWLIEHPSDIKARLFLAGSLRVQGDYDAAERQYQHLAAAGRLPEEELIGYCEVLHILGKNNHVVTKCSNLAEGESGDGRVAWYVGYAHLSLGNYQESLRYLITAARRGVKDYRVLWGLAVANHRLGMLEDATRFYVAALVERPEERSLRSGYAKLLADMGQTLLQAINQEQHRANVQAIRDAVGLFEKAHQYDSEDPSIAELLKRGKSLLTAQMELNRLASR